MSADLEPSEGLLLLIIGFSIGLWVTAVQQPADPHSPDPLANGKRAGPIWRVPATF